MKEAINITSENAVLGAVIVRLREEHIPPMLQKDLAKQLELTDTAWSRVEKGETELSAAQLRKISNFFGVSADHIFDLAEMVYRELMVKGIGVKSQAEMKGISKSLGPGALAAISASGFIPVFGPVLGGIVSATLAFHHFKNMKHKEQS